MTKAIQPKLFTETTLLWRNYRALYVDNKCCVCAVWNQVLFFFFGTFGWFLGQAVDQNHKITWIDEARAIADVAKTQRAFFTRLEKTKTERSPDFTALENDAASYVKALEKRVDQLLRFNLSTGVSRPDIKEFKSEVLDRFHKFCELYVTVNHPTIYAGLQPTIEKIEQATHTLFKKLKKAYPVSILKKGPSTQPKKTVRFADKAPANPPSSALPPLSPDQRESMALCFGEMLNNKKKSVASIGQKILDAFLKTGKTEVVQKETILLFTAIQELVRASENPLVLQAAPELRINGLDTCYQAMATVIDEIQDNINSLYTHAEIMKLWLRLANSLELPSEHLLFLERFPEHVAKLHNDSPEYFQWAGGFEALRNYAQMMSEAYLCVYPNADTQDVENYAKRQVASFLSIIFENFTQWEGVEKQIDGKPSYEVVRLFKDPFKDYAKSATVLAHLKTHPLPNDPIRQTVEIGKHIHHFAKPGSEEALSFLAHVLSAPQVLK